jgi:hypothetical protein
VGDSDSAAVPAAPYRLKKTALRMGVIAIPSCCFWCALSLRLGCSCGQFAVTVLRGGDALCVAIAFA